MVASYAACISRPFSCIITVALYYPEFRRNTVKETDLNSYITERPSAGIVITGDINQQDPRPLSQRFDLRKIVKAPTRGQNILDQILTNMGNLYGKAHHLPTLGRSDHQCIAYAPLKHQATGKTIVKTTRNLKADNIRSLGLKLNLENWESVYQAEDVDEKVEALNNILSSALNTCAPLKRVRMHQSDKEWMTPSIKGQIRARQTLDFLRAGLSHQHCLMCLSTTLMTIVPRELRLAPINTLIITPSMGWCLQIATVTCKRLWVIWWLGLTGIKWKLTLKRPKKCG